MQIHGWGRYPIKSIGRPLPIDAVRPLFPTLPTKSAIAHGQLRSYGDAALPSDSGTAITINALDHLIAFDRKAGTIEVQAGVRLDTILNTIIPHGWFLPSVPGTSLISVGGAIANDVHGKNHHRMGTFGHSVIGLTLLRSDGSLHHLSDQQNCGLFHATIGGLGLTGIILSAKLKLRPVTSTYFDSISHKYMTLDAFFDLAAASEARSEYSVAWLDCVAPANQLGRGHFIEANHAEDGTLECVKRSNRSVPFTPPFSLVNQLTIKPFNAFYYHRQQQKIARHHIHYEPYLFPLDALHHWNRIYGQRGFVQHQCVIPNDGAQPGIRALLERIRASGNGSFLAVLKHFGDTPGRGLLSFTRPGITLALDFARTHDNLALIRNLDAIVRDHGGAIYLAKDACTDQLTFELGYPALPKFRKYIDPQLRSSLSDRLGIT